MLIRGVYCPKVSAKAVVLPDILGCPVPSPSQRRGEGRLRRKEVSRSSHASWEPSSDRADPVDVLIESNRTRLQDLVSVRYRRMLDSPFAFLRGSSLVMALDLATTSSSGIAVQLCGDAHLMNFGIFASPERRLLFDLNDFDETWVGPFEWDVKRLAASVIVAGRANAMSPADCRAAAIAAAHAYRRWMIQYSEMTHLEIWYSGLNAEELRHLVAPSDRRATQRTIERARGRDNLRALSKLTAVVNGRRRIVPDPPLVTRVDADPSVARQLPVMIDEYRATLAADRRELFDRYRLVDVARKVVGVGSVGTRCWILLFQGPNGGPLFLQVKEAGPAAPELAGIPGDVSHHGQRVVEGQRLLQSASDVLLGWTSAPETGVHYYIRQLWDAKGSADIASMSPMAMRTYAGVCGWALARAHARTGDSLAITGYLGASDRFDEAIASFGEAYADQTERDHAALQRAADNALIPCAPTG